MSELSDKMRSICAEGDAKRDAGLQTPDDVIRYDDIVYGTDAKWQVLDLYRPAQAGEETLPVIISFHGGGWVYGSKEVYQFYCMSLSQEGFAVVNFTYRLAPEFQYPAPLVDMNLVMNWIRENADRYHLDCNHVFGVGDSAGADGLGLYCGLLTNPDFAASLGKLSVTKDAEKLSEMNGSKDLVSLDATGFHPVPGLTFRAVALNCGAYHMEAAAGVNEDTAGLMADYLPEGGKAGEYDLVCVDNHVTKDFPPAFLMTCPKDFLLDQAPILVKKLTEEGVPFVYRFFADPDRSLGHVFHVGIKSPYAREVNHEEVVFFKKFL